MEFVEEYLRSCCGVMRASLAYIIRKAITVQTYAITLSMQVLIMKWSAGCYTHPKTRINCTMSKMYSQSRAYGRVQNRQKCLWHPRSDLQGQHKSKRDGTGTFYAIHSRWGGPNHVNTTASKAEMSLLMFTYEESMDLGEVVAQQDKYHIILGNLVKMGTKTLIQDWRFVTCWMASCVTSFPQQLLQ